MNETKEPASDLLASVAVRPLGDRAVLADHEASVRQALSIVTAGRVSALGGGTAQVRVQTLCLHGDHPQAAERARRLVEGLTEAGIILSAPQI